MVPCGILGIMHKKEKVPCLVSGTAHVWLEDDDGKIRKVHMEPL